MLVSRLNPFIDVGGRGHDTFRGHDNARCLMSAVEWLHLGGVISACQWKLPHPIAIGDIGFVFGRHRNINWHWCDGVNTNQH